MFFSIPVLAAEPASLFSVSSGPAATAVGTPDDPEFGNPIASAATARRDPSIVGREPHTATLRHRTARVDLGRLRELKDDSELPITLNLFDDTSFRLVSPQFAPTSAGYSLSAGLEGVYHGTATLVVNGEIVVGSVNTGHSTFAIRPVGRGGLVRISELGQEAVQFDEPPAHRLGDRGLSWQAAGSRSTSTADEDQNDEDAIIDLLVVWSPEAEEEAGSGENMVATVDHLVAYANKAFADSGTQVRLNVPHMQMVDTEDDGGLNVWHSLHGRETALDHRNVRETVMDLRERAGADLVHFVASGYPCSGIANILTDPDGFDGSHLSMTMYACTSNVFVHEIGHNFGLRHERYLDARKPQKVAAYSHGYVNQAAFEPEASRAVAWKTIMAYGEQCADLLWDCQWLPRFSNPDQTYLGDPLGVPGEVETHGIDGPADARRTINETSSSIAGYRNPRPNLTVAATVDAPALDMAESFSLSVELANRGRAGSEATVLVAYRSQDPEFSEDDEEAGRLAVDALGASSTRLLALDLSAPADPGTYYYVACVGDDVAVVPCDAVQVTVGPTVSVSDAEATEGQPIRFPVSLSSAFPVDVRVTYAVSRNTAVSGLDFIASAGTVTIASGTTEAWIEVETVDDETAEPHDALGVALSGISPSPPEGPVVSADSGGAAGTIIDDDGEFAIPDRILRRAVARALGKDPNAEETVSAADMATLTSLAIEGSQIEDLTGLEFATELASLELRGISANLAAIGHLARLRSLSMPHWRGENLEPLRALETLTILHMPFAVAEDLSPLAGLVRLRRLDLTRDFWFDRCSRRGLVSDLSPLAGLADLRELLLDCNRVADVSPLAGMTKLRKLSLRGNEVSNLGGLEDMPSLWLLWLDGNPLSDLHPIRDLNELSWLSVNGARVADVSPLSGMTKMSILELGHNGSISNISALQSMRSCATLDLSGNDISDLTPLQYLQGLWTLDLRHNRIAELAPLSKLTLRNLNLDGNLIRDVSALRDVPLIELSLRGNLIESVAPLGDMTTLRRLWLDGNVISDIGPLAKLTRLRDLSLGRNAIANIAALADLSELHALDLSDNLVRDIAPLAGLPRLESLQLADNLIVDISALSGDSRPAALRTVYLFGNPLSEDSVGTHVPRLRDAGVSVYRAVALATDASAKEGEDLEAVVRLTEAVAEPVALNLGAFGSKVGRSRLVVDIEPTAGSDDFDTTDGCIDYIEACREIGFDAGTTEAVAFLRVWDDRREEPHEVFVLELFGSTAGLPAGVTLPHRRPGWGGVRISQAVGLVVDSAGPSHTVPLFPTAGDDGNQGFVRIANLGGRSAVHIEAVQDDGLSLSTTLSIRRGETSHFNSNDLEDGNFGKGLSSGVGRGGGDWRLRLWSNEIRALSYIRTPDGFLTSMHDLVVEGPMGMYRVPIFNPGSNRDQVSELRLANEGDADANIEISGTDDNGTEAGPVRLSLASGSSRTLTAQDLESGIGLDGGLGDGQGKWRLRVASDVPLAVASLLRSPTGHLTNLSTMPANKVAGDGETTHQIPYFPAAADANGRQGFARVINHGAEEAVVGVVAYDDAGMDYSTSLKVRGGAAVNFNSDDLELGNADKGLEGIGAGTGAWRLEIASDAELDVLAYIRHRDGFLTSMHDVALGTTDHRYEVPTFNPGSNRKQVSSLLLANSTVEDAMVTIEGVDDRGVKHGEVSLAVPALRTVMVSSEDLETGSETTTGSLGDGTGKWRLTVASDHPLWVMSLLESPTGHLTNLSSMPRPGQ